MLDLPNHLPCAPPTTAYTHTYAHAHMHTQVQGSLAGHTNKVAGLCWVEARMEGSIALPDPAPCEAHPLLYSLTLAGHPCSVAGGCLSPRTQMYQC